LNIKYEKDQVPFAFLQLFFIAINEQIQKTEAAAFP